MRLFNLVSCLVVSILVILAAACGGRDVELPDPGSQFESRRPFPATLAGDVGDLATCYGPHRDGQRPGDPPPSTDQLREDLAIMAAHWKLMRIYGSSEYASILLEIIREDGIGMKVVLGAWIAPDSPEANRTEIEAAIRLANEFPDIVAAVCVGNETQVFWSAHRSPLADLIEHVRRVRAAVTVPVTVADDYNFWNKPESPALAAEIDFITLHAHPLWNGLQLAEAVTWLEQKMIETRAMHPEVPIVIGETGWATAVHDQGEQARLIKGAVGETEQSDFLARLKAWTRDKEQLVFFFEAFDENWKGGSHPDEVEKHWGLFRADRSAKAALADST